MKRSRDQQQFVHFEKMSTLGSLVAGVAHEINNPVCYVKTNLQTLREYLNSLERLLDHTLAQPALTQDPQALASIAALQLQLDYAFIRQDLPSLMQEMSEGVERIEGIVADLRDYAYDGDHQGQRVDLNALIDASLRLVQHELKFVVRRLDRHFAELPEVWCRPSQISQVLVNLLVNAAQAMPDGGDLEITTCRVGDAQVELCVSDRGEGIAEAVLPRLFEPFVTTKPLGKGTGLGLSVSAQIVQEHGGTIQAKNRAGGGACFCVILPIDPLAAVGCGA